MMTFEDIEQRLKYHDDFDHGAGVNAETIADAERELGRAFPDSYRRFLQSFGWGCFGNFEIYGLGEDVPMWLDVMTAVNCVNAPLPPHLLPLHYEGDGDHICIDTRRGPGDSAPVVFWDHELGAEQDPQKIADDFLEWIARLL